MKVGDFKTYRLNMKLWEGRLMGIYKPTRGKKKYKKKGDEYERQ